MGIYFIHLLEWYRVFPEEQIMILRLEDYSANRAKATLNVYDFLTLGRPMHLLAGIVSYTNFTCAELVPIVHI